MAFTKIFTSLADRMLAVPLIGLDIADRAIKFAEFSRHASGIKMSTYGRIIIEEKIVENGDIKNPEALVLALTSLRLGGSIFHHRFAAVSLPEEKGFLRIIQVPRVKMEALENTVRWELEGNFPLPPEELYFDYEVVRPREMEPDHYDVLIIAFPRLIVDQYISVLKRAGYIPLALELESQAIARALADRVHPDDPKVFVDIGASRTSFVLVGGGSIILTSTIPLSGVSFHLAIQEALGVDLKEAEAIKQQVGLEENAYEGKVYRALKPLMDTLVNELEKHIDFYRDHLLHRHGIVGEVESIVCTGGDANLVGLDAYLARALKKPVLIGDSFSALKPVLGNYVPPISRKVSLQFTTAIGLAIREMNI